MVLIESFETYDDSGVIDNVHPSSDYHESAIGHVFITPITPEYKLTSVAFYGYKTNDPTGDLQAFLFEVELIDGEYYPTGSPLASSDVINSSTLGSGAGNVRWIRFVFSDNYSMETNHKYAICIEGLNPVLDENNYVEFAYGKVGGSNLLGYYSNQWWNEDDFNWNIRIYGAPPYDSTCDNMYLENWWMSPENDPDGTYCVKLIADTFAFTNLWVDGMSDIDSDLSGINLIMYVTTITVSDGALTITPDLIEDPATQEMLHELLGDPTNLGVCSFELTYLFIDGNQEIPPLGILSKELLEGLSLTSIFMPKKILCESLQMESLLKVGGLQALGQKIIVYLIQKFRTSIKFKEREIMLSIDKNVRN